MIRNAVLLLVGLIAGQIYRCLFSRDRSAAAELAMFLEMSTRLWPPTVRAAAERMVRQEHFIDWLHGCSPSERGTIVREHFGSLRFAHQQAGTWGVLSRGTAVTFTTALIAAHYTDPIVRAADFALAVTSGLFAASAIFPAKALRFATYFMAAAGVLIIGWAPVATSWEAGWRVGGTAAALGLLMMCASCLWRRLERVGALVSSVGLASIAAIDLIDAWLYRDINPLGLTVSYLVSCAGVTALSIVMAKVAAGKAALFVLVEDPDEPPGPDDAGADANAA